MVKKKSTKKTKTIKKTNSKNLYNNLQKWNIGLAILLAVQVIVLVGLSRNLTLPVTTNYLTIDPLASQVAGHTVWAAATRHLFDVRLAWLAAAVLLVPAIIHGLVATVTRRQYEAGLKQEINKFRRVEYILGGGLLLTTIALISGVYDFSTLLAIFAFTEILGLFSLLAEARKEITIQHPRVAGKLALIAGIMPWLVIGTYLFGAQVYGGNSLPAYVYWLYGTILVLSVAMFVIPYLQSQKKGRWADYLYAEQIYMVVGFVAKTALAWQIYAGLLK